MTKFVFILAPPYSGSTVLTRLIETSPQVSGLPSEGQFLPEVKDVMRYAPWEEDQSLPWDAIKDVWLKYWDETKPICLEKSPPNLIRAGALAEHFEPAYFIVMMREPYAHIEGLARRHNVPPMNLDKKANREERISRAAECWLMFAERQRETIRAEKRVAWFTYETLTTEPDRVESQLKTFLPELGALNLNAEFGVHAVSGTAARALTDLNEQKRKLLWARDFEIITSVLQPHEGLLDFFGYSLRDPAPDQDRIAQKETTRNSISRAVNNVRKVFLGSGKRR